MIRLTDWKIFDKNNLSVGASNVNYAYALISSRNANLDERSQLISKQAPMTRLVCYDNLTSTFEIDKERLSIRDFEAMEPTSLPILVDATTLSFPELLYIMLWAKNSAQKFDVIYIEPENYTYSQVEDLVGCDSLDFQLSIDGPGISMLPHFIQSTKEAHLVVALGFEAHRFGGLVNSEELFSFQGVGKIHGILGLPPFSVGLERVSLNKNFELMKDAYLSKNGIFYSCGANDPVRTYKILKNIHAGIPKNFNSHSKLILAPIGTKPTAVGMAHFAINNRDSVGVIYDFISKKKERTSGIGKIHLWSFRSIAK